MVTKYHFQLYPSKFYPTLQSLTRVIMDSNSGLALFFVFFFSQKEEEIFSHFYQTLVTFVSKSSKVWNILKTNAEINGILLPKLYWLTVSKNCCSDWEKLLKFEQIANILRSLEQFIQTVKGQNNLCFNTKNYIDCSAIYDKNN